LIGHICLADFGLSKEVDGSDAGMHTACGTPSYSAPEVLEGNAYSKSIDWWSFGICLFQFLVGRVSRNIISITRLASIPI
jgi:serine/threonine protein kinase